MPISCNCDWMTCASEAAVGGSPVAAITVADIVEAIEGRIALTACVDHTPCDFEAGCNMKPHWPIINNALRGALAGITLAQLRGPVAAPTPIIEETLS